MKTITWAVIAISLIAGFFITWNIHESMSRQEKQAKVASQTPAQKGTAAKETPAAKTGETPAPEPSTLGRTVVFLVLFVSFAAVLYFAYKEKRGTGDDIPWKDILWQPVFIALGGIVVANALANLFVYTQWRWFWDHQTLFWGVNMALVILVHFTVKKDSYTKIVAIGIALLICIGLGKAIYADNKKDVNLGSLFNFWSSTPSTTVSRTTTSLSRGVPAEIALPIICGCESTGVPGVIQHFEEDMKTPLKNRPKEGQKQSSAIGGCQILTSLHEKRANDEFHLNIRTPEGNMGYAKILYQEDGPERHWGETRRCWGPELAKLGYGERVERKLIYTHTIKAPVDDWSAHLPVDRGFNFTTDWIGPGKPRHQIEYTTRDGNVFVREFPTADGKNEVIQGEVSSFRVKSLEKEIVMVRIVLSHI